LLQANNLHLTGDVALHPKPEDDSMTTNFPLPERTESFTDPEAATSGMQNAEPDFALADAEEEEFLELWAADRGNQAA
jgi:hypothetical protein